MPAQGSSGSCSCTSCMYKSESESPSVRRIILEGSRIDKLYLGKYIPLREQKLLNKLIKTRTAYDTARDYSDYDGVSDKGNTENDRTERSSAISGLRRRSSAVRVRPSYSRRGNQLTSKSTVISKTKKNRGSHLRVNKNVSSSPCVCPERCPELFHRPSKSRQSTAHKRKSQHKRGMQDGARKSLEKIKNAKNKMKGKAAHATKSMQNVFQSKSRQLPDMKNLSKAGMEEWECDYPCDPEECDPEECYEILMGKNEMMRMYKHPKENHRHVKHHGKSKPPLNANLQAQTSKTAVKAIDRRRIKQGNKETDMKESTLSVGVGPKDKRRSGVAFKKTKTQDVICECKKSVKSNTDITDDQSKSPVRTASTGIRQAKVKKRKNIANTASDSSVSSLPKSEKSVQDKETKTHKKRTESKRKLVMRDTQASISLKRCFCTLKLKPKKRKEKSEKTSISEALKTTRKESGSQTNIPTLKTVKVTANKSTDVSQTSSGVSKSSVTDIRKSVKAISPNKLKKKHKFHQKGQDSSESEVQTQKRMLVKAVHSKEKDIKHKQSQGRVSTGRSKYTFTKHGLKRCFCTLKLRKSEDDDSRKKRGKQYTEKRNVESEYNSASRSNATSNTPAATPRNKENIFINKKPRNKRVITPDRVTNSSNHTNKQHLKEHGSQGDYSLPDKTSVAHTKKQKKPVLSTAIKRCFCTLKLLKSGKAIKKEVTTTGTESPHFTESKDEKLMTKAVNTKDYRHNYEIEPGECESGVCVPAPGLCDPYECLKQINLRAVSSSLKYGVPTNHTRQKAEFGSTTNRDKPKTKSTTSVSTASTSSSGTIPTTIKLKQKKSSTRSRKPRNKHTLKEYPQSSKSKPINMKAVHKARVPKKTSHNIQQPAASKSRQVVRIGSSFSFDIQFYKDRPLYAIQKSNYAKPKRPLKTTSSITEASRTLRNKSSGVVTTSSQGTLHATENKSNRGINPILKRCFCTLSLRKQHEHQIRKQNARKTHQVYTLSSISTTRTKVTAQNKIFESRDHHMIKNITSRQKIKEELINSLTADYFFDKFSPSKETVNSSLMRILEVTSLPECICDSMSPYQTVSIHSKFSVDLEYVAISNNFIIPTAQSEDTKYTDPTVSISGQGTHTNPYLNKCFCTLNTQIEQTKNRQKLKPYECEPGICIPDECDPNDCQKIIMKRLGKMSSKMSGTGTISSATGTYTEIGKKKKGKKMQSAKQVKSTKSANAVKTQNSDVTSEAVYKREPPAGIVYKSEPNTSRRQAVRVGSSFSFAITFAKNKGNKRDFSEPPPVPKKHRPVSPEKRVKDMGTRGSTTGQSDQDTQSRALLVDKGSNVYPRLKRCFCTLKLQKRNKGKGTAVDLKENQSTITTKRKQRVRADFTSQSTMTPPNKRMAIAMTETGQNTKKYKGRALDPHECEPNVCIPGDCNPYECLERIKRRNKQYRHKGLATETGVSRSSSSTSTQRKIKSGQQTQPQMTSNQIQSISDKKKHLKKRTQSADTEKNPETKTRIEKPVHSEVVVGGKERQVVRIGSSFSFDIEFYKDRIYPNTGDIEAAARAVRSQQREKAKAHKGTSGNVSQVSRGDLSRIEKRNTDSVTQTMLTKNRGTGPGALKRCFCTLKLHKPGKYPGNQKNIKISTTRSTKARRSKKHSGPTDHDRGTHNPENIAPTSFERGTQGRKLEPYECEPGVCIPGKCDALQCEKLIKQRNRKEFGTSTGIRGTRTISSTSSTTTRGRNTQHGRKLHKRHGKVQSEISKDFSVSSQEKSGSGIKTPIKSSNKQAVKIGSSFSFNIDFYKERENESAVNTKQKREFPTTAASRFQKETTHEITRTQRTRRKAKATGASQSFSSTETQHGQIRADAESMTASFLKRCFCTLSLKKNKVHGKEVKISKRGRNEQVVMPVFVTKTAGQFGNKYKSHKVSYSRQDVKSHYLKEKRYNGVQRKMYTDSINEIGSLKPSKLTGLRPFMKSSFFAFRAETESKSAPKGDTGSKKAPKTKQSAAIGPDQVENPKGKNEVKVLHRRNKNNHLDPGECPPGLCIPAPGKCDPYRCLEAMKGQRGMRSTMVGPERRHGRGRSISSNAGASSGKNTSSLAGPSGKHNYVQLPSPRYRHGGTDAGQYVVEEPRFKPLSSPLRQAVRISSSFSFNVEFYKDKMSGIPSVPVEQEYAQPVRPSMRQQGVVCDQKICTTDKGVCQQGICLRHRGLQAYSPNTDTVGTGDSRLKRCFCTLKLQKLGVEMRHANPYADQQVPVAVDAMDRGVRTRDKYLEPYECEPGICVPGSCDPYECLKRMNAGYRNVGTGMPCPFKCAETLTPGGYRDRGTGSHRRPVYRDETASARERWRERDRPPRYTQTHDEPHRPIAQEMGGMVGRQAVRYGSSFKFDIELFKDRMYPGGAGPTTYTSGRPSNVQRYRGAHGGYQTPRKSTVSQGQSCNDSSCRNQRTQMAGAQTESRSAGGSLLKRCFCTLKLQKPYAQTKTVGYVSIPTNFNEFKHYNNVSKHRNTFYKYPKQGTERCIQAYRVSVDNSSLANENRRFHGQKFYTKHENLLLKRKKSHPHHSKHLQNNANHERINSYFSESSEKRNQKDKPEITRQYNMLSKLKMLLKNALISSLSKPLPPKIRNTHENEFNKNNLKLQPSIKNIKKRPKITDVCRANTKLLAYLPKNIGHKENKKFITSKEYSTYEMKTIYPYRPIKYHKGIYQYENTKTAQKRASSRNKDKIQFHDQRIRSKTSKKEKKKNEINNKSNNIDQQHKKRGFWKHIKQLFIKPLHSKFIPDVNDIKENNKFTDKTLKRKLNSSQSERYPISSKFTSKYKKSKSVKVYRDAKKQTNYDKHEKYANQIFCRYQYGDVDQCMSQCLHSPISYGSVELLNRKHIIRNERNQHNSKSRFSAFADQKIVQFAMISSNNECKPEQCTKSGERCACNAAKMVTGKNKNEHADQKLNKQKKGKAGSKSNDTNIFNQQGNKDERICETPNPCACCLKKKKYSNNAAGGECIKECATKPLKPPPPPQKNEDCGKPLFEMKMEADSMAIMNREQIIRKLNKLKSEKEMSAEMLEKLHGKKCQCCICKQFKGKAKVAARLAVMGDKTKKCFGPKPCVCGSEKCETEVMKERMFKLEQKRKKKRKKTCVCGSKICGDEAIKIAVKNKVITKEKGDNIKKKRQNATVEKMRKRQRKQKDKRHAQDLASRQRRYKNEDAIRRKQRLKQDKDALKQVQKYKNSGTLILCAESAIDVFKLAVTTVVTFLRCTIRSILDPKVTWRKLRDAKDDPTRLMSTVSGAWSESGISSTARRVGLRMRHMPLLKSAVDRLESNAATSFVLHSCDKDQKARMKAMAKFKQNKRTRKREPMDFECSLFMASLRKRPHLWVFYKCPWFYPHCVGMLNLLRQFTDATLFLLAVIVWSPCIICMEICRTGMCCTACTA